MSEHTPYYLHLDNGDYNIKEGTIGDLLSTIEFELEKGGAKQLMVTKEFQESHPLHTTARLIADNKRLRKDLFIILGYLTGRMDFYESVNDTKSFELVSGIKKSIEQALNESE